MKDYFVLLVLMISLFAACSSEIKEDSTNETQNFINWLNSSQAKEVLDENRIIRGV